MYKQFFSKKEDSDYIKYRSKIIDRLISIKVLKKSFYSNILIKIKL